MTGAWPRRIWLVPATATLACLVVLASNALKVWEPADLGWLLEANSLWTLPLTIALLTGSIAAFWWPRRDSRSVAPLASAAAIAGVAMTLGLVSYWPCTADEARFVAPLTWSLALFAGEIHTSAFAEGADCAGPYPLALQLARLLALSVTFAGVAAAGLTLWRAGAQRLSARRSGDMDVVVGVNALADPVIRHLAVDAGRSRRRRVVAVADDISDAIVDELRSAGAIVVSIDPLATGELRPIITRHGKVAVRRLYVLSDSGDYNRRVAEIARRVLEEPGVLTGWVPAILVRLDDPREADNWRVGHALDDEDVLMDAVSATEMTAGLLVDFLMNHGISTVNLVGDGPMSVAILGELAARRGWAGALSESRGAIDDPLPVPKPVWSGMTVRAFTDDPDAELEWLVLRRRAATALPVPNVEVQFHLGHAPRVDVLVPSSGRDEVATVFIGGPDVARSDVASRLARTRPNSIVLAPDQGVVGVAATAAHGRLYRYGLALVPSDTHLPVGGWDRMARMQHEVYRYRSLTVGRNPRPTQLVWDELTDEVRDSNTEQIRSVMRWVRDLGYEWVADAAGDSTSELTAEDLERVAERMHSAWVGSKVAAGFVYGNTNDPSASPPTSTYLLPWVELPEPNRQENVLQVRAAITRARVFGLNPHRVDDGLAGRASAQA